MSLPLNVSPAAAPSPPAQTVSPVPAAGETPLPMCSAMSRPLVPGKPESYMICTRDPGHKGNHTSCDGRGHVLASWLRMPIERYWTRELEAGHRHG